MSFSVNISKIFQGDGNDTINSNDNTSNDDTSSNDGSESSDGVSDEDYCTDDEMDPEPIPANLVADVAGKLKVSHSKNVQQSSYIPLGMMLNARSLYNKIGNFRELMHQIGPDLILASETWERKRKPLTRILS